jgi:hypothetical protein
MKFVSCRFYWAGMGKKRAFFRRACRGFFWLLPPAAPLLESSIRVKDSAWKLMLPSEKPLNLRRWFAGALSLLQCEELPIGSSKLS